MARRKKADGVNYRVADFRMETIWLPFVGDYRTFLVSLGVRGAGVLQQIDVLALRA